MTDIRYYMGRIKCRITSRGTNDTKKAVILYLETGTVGNNREGYKPVLRGDYDIVPIRMLWRNKK